LASPLALAGELPARLLQVLFARHQRQRVSRFDDCAAGRHEVHASACDEHDQRAFRQVKVNNLRADDRRIWSNVDVHRSRVSAFDDLNCRRQVLAFREAQAQPPRDRHDRDPLDEHRAEHDEEDKVEHDVGALDAGNQRERGQDDRRSAAQPQPR